MRSLTDDSNAWGRTDIDSEQVTRWAGSPLDVGDQGGCASSRVEHDLGASRNRVQDFDCFLASSAANNYNKKAVI